jgi:hypothetical protein
VRCELTHSLALQTVEAASYRLEDLKSGIVKVSVEVSHACATNVLARYTVYWRLENLCRRRVLCLFLSGGMDFRTI